MCLDMGKGNEKPNLRWDVSYRQLLRKKNNYCVNSADQSVLLDLSVLVPDVGLKEEERQWRGGASSGVAHWPSGAGREC